MSTKIATIIESLPTFTQISLLYPVLGSLNSSAINSASREVARELKNMESAARAAGANVIAIDKYNELLNELRQNELDAEHAVNVGLSEVNLGEHTKDVTDGFESVEHIGDEGPTTIKSAITHKEKIDRISTLLELRAPLLAIFNTAIAKLPNSESGADFSFEESLARQLAREFSLEQRAADETDKALISTGAVTAEELAATDKAAFDADQNFKKEFKFLILDKLRDKEPFDATIDDADAAFEKLGFEFQERLLRRILPKLEEAKRQQIGRRGFDPDASTNIILIGLAINEFKKVVGPSEADEKLAKLQAALAS